MARQADVRTQQVRTVGALDEKTYRILPIQRFRSRTSLAKSIVRP